MEAEAGAVTERDKLPRGARYGSSGDIGPLAADRPETTLPSSAWAVVMHSPKQTERLAARLGTIVEKGAVIVLDGDLGAGKTTFVRGLARGLGLPESVVSSPTFTLIHEYEGEVPLYHFDAYRLDVPDEFFALGADEYLSGDGVCAIEWGTNVRSELNRERLEIVLRTGAEADDASWRHITMRAYGTRPAGWLAALRHQWESGSV